MWVRVTDGGDLAANIWRRDRTLFARKCDAFVASQAFRINFKVTIIRVGTRKAKS